MSVLVPLLAFIFGWIMARYQDVTWLKQYLSRVLARCLIPLVIIYNVLFYQNGSLALMLFSFMASILVYGCCVLIFKDRLVALCASYNNIGWLGFPLAVLIFGSQVSAAMIALYVGSSLFGNVWAVRAMRRDMPNYLDTIKIVIKTPPVIALVIAIVLHLCAVQDVLQGKAWVLMLYAVAKWALIVAGMVVLGLWLSRSKITIRDLKHSARVMLVKIVLATMICALLFYSGVFAMFFRQPIAFLWFLFCLPPAGNIVALETHYRATGESAAYIAAGTAVSAVVIGVFTFFYLLF